MSKIAFRTICLQGLTYWPAAKELKTRVRQRSGTKSNHTLAKGHVLFQKRLGTAAMPIKGGTQEVKFQRLLSLDLHATQTRLERPEGEEGLQMCGSVRVSVEST